MYLYTPISSVPDPSMTGQAHCLWALHLFIAEQVEQVS